MLTLLSARLQCDLDVFGAFGPKLAELSAGDHSCAERLDTLPGSFKRSNSKGTRPRPRGDALDARPSAAGESAEMAWRWVAYVADRMRRGTPAACVRRMTRGGGNGARGLLSMLLTTATQLGDGDGRGNASSYSSAHGPRAAAGRHTSGRNP